VAGTFYRLESTVVADGDVVDLHNPNGRISSFFIWDRGDDKSLAYAKPRAEAQELIRLRDVLETDYLRASIGVPLFSYKARTVLAGALPGEIRFYDCTVRCDDSELPFFLGKVLRYLPLVDEERSRFRTLAAGQRVLSQAVYRTDAGPDFAIARDAEFRERLVVSQRFVDLCHDEGLNVGFAEPV
jgi:hypothetical protein